MLVQNSGAWVVRVCLYALTLPFPPSFCPGQLSSSLSDDGEDLVVSSQNCAQSLVCGLEAKDAVLIQPLSKDLERPAESSSGEEEEGEPKPSLHQRR